MFTDIRIEGNNISGIHNGQHVSIGILGITRWCGSDEEQAKNAPYKAAVAEYARLIAAAPSLYRALREMLYQFDAGDDDELPVAVQDALILAREAIRLVAGEYDEYGACACSHGKSDHHADPADGHPFCAECPRGQDHHEYAGEDK